MCGWRLLPTLRRESIDRNTLYWLEFDGARLLRPRPALCGERAARCVNEKKRVRDDFGRLSAPHPGETAACAMSPLPVKTGRGHAPHRRARGTCGERPTA